MLVAQKDPQHHHGMCKKTHFSFLIAALLLKCKNNNFSLKSPVWVAVFQMGIPAQSKKEKKKKRFIVCSYFTERPWERNKTISTSSSKDRKMKEEHVKLCESVLDSLKTTNGYSLFIGPAIVALETETLKETYRQMITEPRDFALIRSNLENNAYPGVGSFEEDVELCFSNSKRFCKLYYPAIVKLVDGTEKAFRKAIEKVHKKLEQASAAPVSAPVSSSSSKKPVAKPLARATTTTTAAASSSSSSSFPGFEAKCEAIITGLESLAGLKWFLTPVDPANIPNYLVFVTDPMDIITIRKKLGVPTTTAAAASGNSQVKRYISHNEFAYDFRTMIGNFLRYNNLPSAAKLRRDVVRVLLSFEAAWMKLSAEITATMSTVSFAQPVDDLKELLQAVEEVMKVRVTLPYLTLPTIILSLT